MTEFYDVSESYGKYVFDETVMRERLPKAVFKAFKETLDDGKELELSVAEVIASVMKDWALEKGATHYTHWFQPMTGITAEKHDSFISPKKDGSVIMEFSGKELIKGEPDASSFPSGGLRATFEARGYTAWDPTSYAFVKDGTLYIPTAFCSYGGEALDKKTPLLRSMEVISTQAMRILRLFGNTTSKRVIPTVGPEQEYFLVDKTLYEQRKDLIFTGRTLFGAAAPKGQELEDQYFGSLKQRVSDFMKELDKTMWELGVPVKTKHNEVAPSQHECAPIFESANLAADHNQLLMDVMKKLALKHGLVCLLHEKPFAGVNGSGKHNNWSICTDDGINLLDPGNSPSENAQFLLFLTAVIKAVEENADLLRIAVASAGNDHRLGANEAPPAIISIFLGEELTDVVDCIIEGKCATSKASTFDIGLSALPKFPKDTTDRNRTSPFAFTGNKFEFRSLGSAFNIAGPNIVLNTIVADALKEFADELEKAEDFNIALQGLIVKTLKEKKRIIFNGNNYSEEWVREAEKRGLPNYRSTVDALPHFADKKNVELFVRHKVFSEIEVHARMEILIESYNKALNVEALTTLEIAKRDIIPAVIAYEKKLADTILAMKSVGVKTVAESSMINNIANLLDSLYSKTLELEKKMIEIPESSELEKARYFHDVIFVAMQELRAVADSLETAMPSDYWPMPTYADLLFYI